MGLVCLFVRVERTQCPRAYVPLSRPVHFDTFCDNFALCRVGIGSRGEVVTWILFDVNHHLLYFGHIRMFLHT